MHAFLVWLHGIMLVLDFDWHMSAFVMGMLAVVEAYDPASGVAVCCTFCPRCTARTKGGHLHACLKCL